MKKEQNTRILTHSESILSKKEKYIDKFIEENPHLVVSESISNLAKSMKINASNISRYIRKIGFKKYLDFRFYFAKRIEFLAIELQEDKISKYEEIILRNKKYMDYALQETSKRLNPNSIQRSVDAILKSEINFCFGSGSSCLAAYELSSQFLKKELNSIHYFDFDNFKKIFKINSRNKNVSLVLFSRSLMTPDILHLINYSKDKDNIKLIIISSDKAKNSYKNSIGIKYSTLENHPHFEVSSKVGQMYIATLLYSSIDFNKNYLKNSR